METLLEKVEVATILGTIQSTLTKFGYLRKRWQDNTEEERLLGVSLTGIIDSSVLNLWNGKLPDKLRLLREKAVAVNEEWSRKLGIPQSTAITCVKPSGTVSQLVDSASGIHARHAPYYIRTVRGDNKDPLTEFMKDKGIPNEPDVMNPDHTTVFSFPMRANKSAVFRTSMSAIEQLEIWKVYAEHWCEHKPSVTVSVKEQEWMNVGNWCWDNFNHLSGVSFLPFSDHTYKQAPYQDITEEEYKKLAKKMPKNIDWKKLQDYETEDTTKGSQELACTAGFCELVDI